MECRLGAAVSLQYRHTDITGHGQRIIRPLQSLFAAGAHSVLASHWAVDSKATTRLMTQLFTALQQEPHPRKAEALRHAMLEALATPAECGLLCWLGWQDAPQPAHPAYWAAFTMYGE
ncbi:MAG: CHAT domain-containing protein [Candidatus Thiothrix singaporensis]|uniref:CHAT domain-containing protein n=1 Tax=Candidatus Thiothrix singaporensis TaxID=2799669 RepID=A0A7L6AZL9_9GAMM|nr:MAG: CHAT domain-containing protein [Candidatus Thiothrix singaporensis]